jgi:hypothetical protein
MVDGDALWKSIAQLEGEIAQLQSQLDALEQANLRTGHASTHEDARIGRRSTKKQKSRHASARARKVTTVPDATSSEDAKHLRVRGRNRVDLPLLIAGIVSMVVSLIYLGPGLLRSREQVGFTQTTCIVHKSTDGDYSVYPPSNKFGISCSECGRLKDQATVACWVADDPTLEVGYALQPPPRTYLTVQEKLGPERFFIGMAFAFGLLLVCMYFIMPNAIIDPREAED